VSVKVAVVGCGTWGKNLVRNFYNLEALYGICDMDSDLLYKTSEEYKGINCINNFEQLLKTKELNGVVIATPSHTH